MTDRVAILAGKLSAGAIRLSGAGLGSNLPGRIARAVSRGVLTRLSGRCRLGVVAVSGTNGKSTTAGFVRSIFKEAGLKAVHNRQGANLITGVTATLVDAASWRGDLDADYGLFEIDEASLPVVAREVEFAVILVTNLFRDQLDRFGELDTTARLISEGIAASHCQAVLNADDPIVAQLSPDSARTYYGIQSLAAGSQSGLPAAAELSYCSACGCEHVYDLVLYSQLGHYRCPACGKARPTPQVIAACVAVTAAGSRFSLTLPDGVFPVEIALPGLFNVYNAVGAAAMAASLGISGTTISAGLTKYTTLFGRSERLELEGKPVLIQLIKNPAGASQVVATVAADAGARIVIAINDNTADGRDVSWLWDADFEQLAGSSKELVVSGRRAHDMAVRMKYAGMSPSLIKVVPSLSSAVRYALDRLKPGETLWILPTYTCLLELQKIFKTLGHPLAET